MCFHWKSLLRQVRISGDITLISDNEADQYFNSRPYISRIGAWSSNQSKPMEARDSFLNKVEEYKKKFHLQIKITFQDQSIGLDFCFPQKKLSFGKMLKEDFTKD